MTPTTPQPCSALLPGFWDDSPPEWDYSRLDEGYEAEFTQATEEHQARWTCGKPAIHYSGDYGFNCPIHALEVFTMTGHPAQIVAGWLETTRDLNACPPCCNRPACDPCGL